jgi:hypothetical protein
MHAFARRDESGRLRARSWASRSCLDGAPDSCARSSVLHAEPVERDREQCILEVGRIKCPAADKLPKAIGDLIQCHVAGTVSGAGQPIRPQFPAEVIATAGVGTTLGAGTEDAAVMIDRDKCILFRSAPMINVYPDVLSGNAAVRIQARAYVALLSAPKAVGKVTGSGFIAPAGGF